MGTHVKKLEEVKNEKRIKWTPELLEAFETMQQIVQNAPILSEFIPGLPTFLQTDASKNALGGMLYQIKATEQELSGVSDPLMTHGKIRYIGFFSKSLNAAQMRYKNQRRELLAVLMCIEKFKIYLKGRKFKVLTDNASITHMKTQPMSEALAAAMHFLSEYDFEIVHLSGKNNVYPDLLSRQPITISHRFKETKKINYKGRRIDFRQRRNQCDDSLGEANLEQKVR